jgi:6-pyruvoyltetrahydropterin/6-carboxytetrahydropterin synthase
MWEAHRYHDISCGHRVYGHENKCAHAHGHNYRIHFHCAAALDSVGRVIDFAVIKSRLCEWLEENYDHRFLLWRGDPWLEPMRRMDPEGVIAVSYNPTAENIAEHLVMTVGPAQLHGTGVILVKCIVEETAKCSASYQRTPNPSGGA